jgi:hypothetical protein
MQLPNSGSYSLTRPSLLTEARWTAEVSGSSIQEVWESGDHHRIGAYVQIGNHTGSEATYSAVHIQQALDEFVAQASRSQYDLSGSLLWKDNRDHHPFIDR